MLDDSNVGTFYSLRALSELSIEGKKPLILWVGAGTSCWREFPTWKDLAQTFHARFSKVEGSYNRGRATRLLDEGDYPALFQLCKDANDRRYSSMLTDSLRARKTTPVYVRFIESLDAIQPLHILTTNIDESLENSLEAVTTLQRSDVARSIELLHTQEPFILKTHGTLSQLESAVFTSSDYESLLNNNGYLELIKHIFTEAVILFIGYGLAEQYVLDLLSASDALKGIFGSTSHYAVVSNSTKSLPHFITPINYLPVPHRDHRAAIQVLEEIGLARETTDEKPRRTDLRSFAITSSHFVSDILPAGTYNTGTEYTCSDGSTLVQGFGLTDEEMPQSNKSSMHDLIVGLLCFDTVYTHLPSVGSLAKVISESSFEILLRHDCLRFIDWPYQQLMHFPQGRKQIGGSLLSIGAMDVTPEEQLQSTIGNMFKPIPGMEAEAQETLDLVKHKTTTITRDMEPNIPKTVCGLLLRPSIRKLLGMSGGTSSISIPDWMVYPILRLVYMTKLGATCQTLGIASTKLDHGCDELAAPAFAAATGAEWADGMASYVLTQSFDTDLGAYSLVNQDIVSAILRFRDSHEGISLRKEILEQLAVRQGSDFIVSVNAGLRATIPTKTLQAAHDRLKGLLMAEGAIANLTPALWNNTTFTNGATALWRKKSAKRLEEYCREHQINRYDQCPCNSGEKLRFCCEEALAE